MEIRLLGPIELRDGGAAMPLAGAQQRAVLAMLALRAGATVSADQLSAGLWDERAPASAPKMVQLYVSQLRKLGLDIVTRGRGYALQGAEVDAVKFEALVERATRGEPCAEEALRLWRGPPLDELADAPFAAEPARRLDELWLQATELASEEALARGEHGALLAPLEAQIGAHPLRERLHAQRMVALYRSGRQADALEAFRQARATLVDEVGIEPGPELRALHERILNQDPTLDVAAPARPVLPAFGRRRLVVIAALLGVAGAAAFVATRVTGPDSLRGIDGDSVGLIDPASGDITEQFGVGHAPSAVVAGGGSVWVASGPDGTVSRIDRARDQVTTIDVGGEPTALAYGAGSLWVADGRERRLTQVSPQTNRVAKRFPAGNAPRSVVVAAGAVWTASPIDSRVDRLDLVGGRSSRLTIPGGPATLAAGAGSVWVAAREAGAVTRLQARTGATLAAVAVGRDPVAMSFAAGDLWVLNRGDATLSRVDPARAAVKATIPLGGRPDSLTAGAGSLWVGDGTRRRIIRVEPRTGRVIRSDPVRASPSALVFAEGSLWASALPLAGGHRGGTLLFASGAPEFCRCLDPAGYDGRLAPLLSAVYDGLVAYRRVGGSGGSALVPDLAERLPVPTDGGRTYVFTLRDGLRFSDGRPVRPEDVRASLERTLRLASPQAPPLYRQIVGAEGCTADGCDLSRGVVTDAAARTVTITLSVPDPELLQELALPLAAIVPAGSPPAVTHGAPLPGTGPYRIERFDVRRGAHLVRNPRFASWSADARPPGFPDVIDWRIVRDAAAQVDAVRKGRLDAVPISGIPGPELPPPMLEALALSDPGRVHSDALPNTDWLFLNTAVEPFDDARVRRAFNLALDRGRIADLTGGPTVATPTCQIVPPGLPGYEPACPYTRGGATATAWRGPDLARARRLVAAAGARGADVTVWSFAGPLEAVAGVGVAALRAIGLSARVRTRPDVARYYAFVGDSRHRVQAGVAGWSADALTPSSFFGPNLTCALRVPRSPANLNLSQFCDRAVDTAVDAARAAVEAESDPLWARADRLVTDTAAVVPMVNRRAVLLVSDRVGNVQQHLAYGPLLDQLWVR